MILEFALRYLLLRQLWVIRQKVSPVIYSEVTKSLTVKRDRNNYYLSWQRDSTAYEKVIPRSTYNFYKRGDRVDSKPATLEVEKKNVLEARLFALEALGIEGGDELFNRCETIKKPHDKVAFFWNIVLCAILAVSSGEQVAVFAGIYLVALSIEFVPNWGRLLTAFALCGLIFVDFPLVVFLVGGGYALFQFLDPNPTLRWLRMTLSVGVGIIGFVLHEGAHGLNAEQLMFGTGILAIAFLTTIWHITVGSHFRSLPLVTPLAAVGMAFEGYAVAAAILCLNTIMTLVAKFWGYNIVSLQREKELKPNG